MKVQFDPDGFIRALEQYADRKEKQIVEGLTKAALEVERLARQKSGVTFVVPYVNAQRISPIPI